jgi:probable HAF family extracellular repeat protein
LGDCYNSALAINSERQVAGFTVSCDGTIYRAFLWRKGAMADLNNLIPRGSSLQLAVASDINNRGEIDGIGVPPGIPLANWRTQGHAFLLIPCDENHPGVEGSNYSLVDVPDAVPLRSPAIRDTASRALPAPRVWHRPVDRYLMPGYRGLGAQAMK